MGRRRRRFTQGGVAARQVRPEACRYRHTQEFGIEPEQLVGVALGDHATHMIVMLALARIGAVMLPIDHRWTAAEQERVASHFCASLVLVEPGQQVAGVPNIAVDEAWQQTIDVTPADFNAAPLAAGGSAPLLVSLSFGTTGRPKDMIIRGGRLRDQ